MSYHTAPSFAVTSNKVTGLADFPQQLEVPQSPIRQLVPSELQCWRAQILPDHGRGNGGIANDWKGSKAKPGGRGSRIAWPLTSKLPPTAGQIVWSLQLLVTVKVTVFCVMLILIKGILFVLYKIVNKYVFYYTM